MLRARVAALIVGRTPTRNVKVTNLLNVFFGVRFYDQILACGHAWVWRGPNPPTTRRCYACPLVIEEDQSHE